MSRSIRRYTDPLMIPRLLVLPWTLFLAATVTSSLFGQPAGRKGVYLEKNGVQIVRNAVTAYRLGWPKVGGAGPNSTNVAGNGNSASLKYPSGATCNVKLDAGGDLSFQFAQLPAKAAALWEMNFGIEHIHGGKFGAGKELKDFPAEMQSAPHLFSGQTPSFEWMNPRSGRFAMTLPPHSYVQLTDLRHWNDNRNFRWTCQLQLPGSSATARMKIRDLSGGADTTAFFVDKFGQSSQSDWPDKVKSEEELKADVAKEKEYYDSFKTVPMDEYGGLAGSGEKLGLKATGYFHVQKTPNRWYLVDPAGNAYFNLGIASFLAGAYTYIEGRSDIYEWLPETGGPFDTAFEPSSYWHKTAFSFHLANQLKKYGEPITPENFAARMIPRIRKLGFNSSGAFSGTPTAAQKGAKFPFVATFKGGADMPGIQRTWDPFDVEKLKKVEESFAKSGPVNAKEPLLIGYFLGNEPLLQDVPRIVPTMKGTAPAKRALVNMLRDKYKTVDAFNQAWELKAESFEAMNDMTLPVRSKAAAADMEQYFAYFLDTFFKTAHDIIRKYDPNHMILGARLQPGTANNELICRAMAKYSDIFGLNYYTYGIDPAYLGRIQEWTGGIPMIFSEFFFDSPKDSGLGGGFKEVGSQKERGQAYRHYVEHAAALPYVVGIQWYVLVDNPATGIWWGRTSGLLRENNGIFSVTDRPWKPLVEAMAETNRRVYELMSGKEKPFIFEDSRFNKKGTKARLSATIGRAEGPIKANGTASGFPGLPPEQISKSQLVEGSAEGDLAASYRLCWDAKYLHLLVEVTDATPMKNSQVGNNLWRGDGVELFVGSEQLDKAGSLLFTDRHILLSGGLVDGKPQTHVVNAAQQPNIEMAVVPRSDGKGYTLQAAIPLEALGIKPHADTAILFDIGIDDSANGSERKCQLMWNGSAKNSGDRTGWGRAKFL